MNLAKVVNKARAAEDRVATPSYGLCMCNKIRTGEKNIPPNKKICIYLALRYADTIP
jgi:hypothetical protein